MTFQELRLDGMMSVRCTEHSTGTKCCTMLSIGRVLTVQKNVPSKPTKIQYSEPARYLSHNLRSQQYWQASIILLVFVLLAMEASTIFSLMLPVAAAIMHAAGLLDFPSLPPEPPQKLPKPSAPPMQIAAIKFMNFPPGLAHEPPVATLDDQAPQPLNALPERPGFSDRNVPEFVQVQKLSEQVTDGVGGSQRDAVGGRERACNSAQPAAAAAAGTAGTVAAATAPAAPPPQAAATASAMHVYLAVLSGAGDAGEVASSLCVPEPPLWGTLNPCMESQPTPHPAAGFMMHGADSDSEAEEGDGGGCEDGTAVGGVLSVACAHAFVPCMYLCISELHRCMYRFHANRDCSTSVWTCHDEQCVADEAGEQDIVADTEHSIPRSPAANHAQAAGRSQNLPEDSSHACADQANGSTGVCGKWASDGGGADASGRERSGSPHAFNMGSSPAGTLMSHDLGTCCNVHCTGRKL